MPPGSSEPRHSSSSLSSEQTEPLMKATKEFLTSSVLLGSCEESMKTADEEVLKAPTRTCCFCCDVRPATALFMIFEIAFFSALLFTGLINIAKASADSITVPYLGLLLCYLISLVGAVLVLYGVFTAKPLLLIPYLIKQLFTITLTLIFIYKAITVYFGHYGITVSTVFRRLYDTDIVSPGIEKLEEIQRFTRSLQFSLSSPTAARHFGGALLLGGCLALCVEIFVTDIVRKCYQYFRDKNRLATSSSRKN